MDLLTHSRMSCAKTCLRKHYFQYELGLRKETTSKPLRMGSAVHLGIDLLAQGCSVQAAIDAATVGYKMIPTWINGEDGLHEWLVEEAIVVRLIFNYAERWPALEVIATEQSFDLPIRNPETGHFTTVFRLAGKIDKIVILPDGRKAIMEHKTTSDSIDDDSDYWRRLRMDQQISLYMCAAIDMGHDVQTVIYDVIKKPTISPKQIPMTDEAGLKIVHDEHGSRVMLSSGLPRQSGDTAKGWKLQSRVETPQEYSVRLQADIESRPEFYYARQEIPRLQSDLDEWRQELWDQQQSIRRCQTKGVWYRNTNACLHPYRCEFMDICQQKITTDGPTPVGFIRVEDVHPELERKTV